VAEQRRAEEAAGDARQERVALEEARLGGARAPTPEGRAAVVALGLTLRVIGAASLCSKVRDPRLPMPDAPEEDPPLEYDLPARASARLGASTSAKAKNSASTADQSRGAAKTGDRVMARSVREPMKISASQYGYGPAAPPRTIDLKQPYLQGELYLSGCI